MFDYGLPHARELILSGHRIAPVMTVDPTAANYANPLPAYEESYPLTHVMLGGDLFWGITSGTNLPHRIGEGAWSPVWLAYTNSASIYASGPVRTMDDMVTRRPRPVSLNPLRQYSAFRFHAREDASLVWDGAEPGNIDALSDAIEAGSVYRLVFEDEEGLVYSLGVDLPMLFRETGSLTITTHPMFAPDFCFQPMEFLDQVRSHHPALLVDDGPLPPPSTFETASVPTFQSLRSDGTYFRLFDIMSGKPKRWKQARLYAY